MPDLIEVRLNAHAPAKYQSVEVQLVYSLLDEPGPLEQVCSNVNAYLTPGVLGYRQDRLADIVALVGDQGKLKPLAVFLQPPILVTVPARLSQQLQSTFWIVGKRLDCMVIEVGLLGKWSGDISPLVVEDVADNLFHVDGHAQGLAHPQVGERLSPQVVANIGVAKTQPGKILVPGVISEAVNLVGLDPIAVYGSSIKFHFLGQHIWKDTIGIPQIVWRAFPVIIKTIQQNVLV